MISEGVMTSLEDQISSSKTSWIVCIALLCTAEVIALITSFRSFEAATTMHRIMLIELPLLVLLPWLLARRGLKLLSGLADVEKGTTARMQLTQGVMMTYVLFVFTMAIREFAH
jgi:hypothetical protein